MKLIVSKKWALSICPGKPRVNINILCIIVYSPMKRNVQDIYTANTMGKNRDTHIHSKGTSINTIMYTMNKKNVELWHCNTTNYTVTCGKVNGTHTQATEKCGYIFVVSGLHA